MPTLAEIPEAAEGLAEAAKRHFQPTAEPREVKPPEPKPAAAKPAEEPPKPAAKIDPPEKVEKPKNEPPAATEEDKVFGTAAAKPKADAAPKPDEEFETTLKSETAGMQPKAQTAWIALRRSEKEATEKARKASEALAEREAALKDQPTDDPKAQALAARLKELEDQLADADKELSITRVERSQKYRREVGGPMEEIAKTAEELATRYEAPVKDMLAALEVTDSKDRAEALSELAADFNEADRIELYQMGREMARLRKVGEALREKARADLSAVEQEEQEESNRTETERSAARAKAAQVAWDTAAREDESLRRNEAAPGWTAELEAALKASREYVVGKDPVADGALIAKGMMLSFAQRKAIHFESKFKAMQAENEKLLSRIEADSALDPNLGGGGDDTDHGDNEVDVNLPLGSAAKLKFGR